MQQGEDQNRIGRREFGRWAVASGIATGLSVAPVGLSATLGAEDTPTPKKADDPKSGAPEPPPPPPEVLLLTYLLRTYPNDHFDEQSVQGVFRDIRGDVTRGKSLAQFSLKNSDEPVFTFQAYRSTDGTPADK